MRHPGDPAGARRDADELRSLGDYYGVTFYAVRDGEAQEIVLRYRPQDEYCEWFVDRDPDTGDMRRIEFTAEGHEYWRFLADGTAAFASRPCHRRSGSTATGSCCCGSTGSWSDPRSARKTSISVRT
ncbi:hypothetical protein [Paractinoplanes toevensis]|uniref:Uncharacterized protein n=1 Tax=Paractinoplanes toevensis TaxID=571911 RepID=A0A919T5P1_9ACTN|nr:hypothetical protein [Actinoplanes toevensis]GIM89648.1 hypothetical protein Ato02nite_014410 [Actinoplanes toevensis]